ncbi:MAG: NADH-quinone oxidoreductase subunit M [Anaerolineae bacterium]|nr:NADH-quinone oxidoreductase subunit M [Anaerolineae bacterium]
MDFNFPILSALIWIPIVAGVLILFMDQKQRDLYRGVAIAAATVVLALSATVFFTYGSNVRQAAVDAEDAGLVTADDAENVAFYADLVPLIDEEVGKSEATTAFVRALAFEERVTWVEDAGVAYHLGVDGLSAPMVWLTGMVAVAGVLISWRISDRQREFLAFFMLLVAGVMGVFISVVVFLLFFFYELAIFPMYILIAGWGWVKLREYAAMKLTLYILVGSVIALVGAIAMYFQAANFFSNEGQAVFNAAVSSGLLPADSNVHSFSMVQLVLAAENGAFDIPMLGTTFAKVWFPFVFMGLAVLAGVFPFHNWSPDGHVAAPTAVSMIHAGVLMKVGAFAALRVGVMLLPSGAQVHLPWIVFLTLINVVYGAFIAFRQRDFKYVIGFSSVSHMGLVSMGFATMNLVGMTGAGLQMFSHGAMTALFFGCVGMVYDRAHTRDLPSLGGFAKVMPWVAFAFILGGLTSMGMPGLSGFVAEYPIFAGMWQASEQITLQIGGFTLSNYYAVIVVIAALGIVLTAAYVLRVTQQVFFGEFDRAKYPDVGDITARERFVLIFLGAPLVILGVAPFVMAPILETGFRPVLAILGVGA